MDRCHALINLQSVWLSLLSTHTHTTFDMCTYVTLKTVCSLLSNYFCSLCIRESAMNTIYPITAAPNRFVHPSRLVNEHTKCFYLYNIVLCFISKSTVLYDD